MTISEKWLYGPELSPYIDNLGELRIQVFADWPYLYKGDLNYERVYLKTYSQSKNSFCGLLIDNNQIVGATTAILLDDETPDVQRPFIEQNFNPQKIIYFGESILHKNYRGKGFGHKFMNWRLDFAKKFSNIDWCAFCAVIRPLNHPKRPQNYKPLDEFWRSYGFSPKESMIAEMSWTDIGESATTKKQLKFWLKQVREDKK